MTDTKADPMAPPARLRRLAQEARRLAAECSEGTAPVFGKYMLYDPKVGYGKPHCCLGHLGIRAGYRLESETLYSDIPRTFWFAIGAASDDGRNPAPDLLALAEFLDGFIEDASKTQKSIP